MSVSHASINTIIFITFVVLYTFILQLLKLEAFCSQPSSNSKEDILACLLGNCPFLTFKNVTEQQLIGIGLVINLDQCKYTFYRLLSDFYLFVYPGFPRERHMSNPGPRLQRAAGRQKLNGSSRFYHVCGLSSAPFCVVLQGSSMGFMEQPHNGSPLIIRCVCF